MIYEKEVVSIAEQITPDPEKQKWLRQAIRDVSGMTWIIPDAQLDGCTNEVLRGMLRRKTNSAEAVLNSLREAAGIKVRPYIVDSDPIG